METYVPLWSPKFRWILSKGLFIIPSVSIQSAELYPFKVGFFLLFHVKYVANSSKENYNIANKFRQKQHVYYIGWKIAFRLLTFNIGWNLPHVDYGIAVKLEITNIGEKPRANLTLTSITLPSFVFIFKKL